MWPSFVCEDTTNDEHTTLLAAKAGVANGKQALPRKYLPKETYLERSLKMPEQKTNSK